ncbi:Solute carrier family 22 member 3 [Holothuria leucospilota]|uniref:Solute carrier family 22 member 3 n=1 Tax=Holothuria leucospilota TaxID=206669 RepID=A0A9Q0YQH8_HOLLE|nr:Solute carrier family 22 member 3 [Holothuria leucospilota]
MTFDDILRSIGSFGRFQKRVIAFVSIPPLAQCAILLAQVFIAGKSDHWCHVGHWQDEDCHQWALTEEECILFKRNISAPMIEGSRSRCSMYNVTGMDLESAFNLQDEFKLSDIINCNEGWEFDRSVFASTISEEWGLVCGNSGITDVLQAIFFVGYLVGSMMFGSVADRIGRYYTFMGCCVTAGISSVLAALAPNVYIFAILRFLSAATSYGGTLMTFVIASELVLPSSRVWTGVYLWFFFSSGYFFLSGVASITYNWRLLLGIISAPYLLMIPVFPLISESPRWLIARGKFKRAEKLIRKMAKTNKKEVPEDLKSMMENENKITASEAVSVLDLIRNPTIRCYMLNMIYSWFVQGFVFFGLSLGTSSLGVNVYLAFCLSGAVEMPAHVLAIITMNKFGRRASTSFWILLAGVACFATIIAPLGPWRVTVATLGKLAISVSFDIVYVYAGEIIPTPRRAFGVGMCSAGSRVGGVVAPLLLYLGSIFESLPLILFASSSILGGLLILLLPETNKKPLPDTIEETLNLRSLKYKSVENEDKDVEEHAEHALST